MRPSPDTTNFTTLPFCCIALLIAAGYIFGPSIPARAHCDTLDGPVITDARIALQRNDVTPVLKWVSKESEHDIRAAFQKATATRSPKGDARREKAEREFFETLVKIHRLGEGADFTGLKSGPVEPIVAAADDAIRSGSSAEVIDEIIAKVKEGIGERLAGVIEAKKRADESVAAGREYVARYVEYVHYVEGLHTAVTKEGEKHNHGVEENSPDQDGCGACPGHSTPPKNDNPKTPAPSTPHEHHH